MSKTKNDKQKTKNLEDAIERRIGKEEYRFSKTYIIDDENAIVIGGRYGWSQSMIHYTMCYGNLIEVTRFPVRQTYGRVLKKHKLFMIMNNYHHSYENTCIAVYDYENCKFVIEKGKFDNIGYDASMSVIDKYQSNYLEKYNCFLGYFTLTCKTDCGVLEQIHYTSLINDQQHWHSFEPPKETYYALINKDGSIRGNRLFKGENLTKIEEVIDLRNYKSLEDFKKQRIEVLTQIKNKNKQDYYERLKRINNVTDSPYLDEEVIKVLTLVK